MSATRSQSNPVPQVVAHRGASADNAEHTLGAYLRALAVGADGLVCDVRLTADGHLVVETLEGQRRVLAVGDVVHLRPVVDGAD